MTNLAVLTAFCPLRSRQAPVQPSRRFPARTLARFLESKTSLQPQLQTSVRPLRPPALLHRLLDSCPASSLHTQSESEKQSCLPGRACQAAASRILPRVPAMRTLQLPFPFQSPLKKTGGPPHYVCLPSLFRFRFSSTFVKSHRV